MTDTIGSCLRWRALEKLSSNCTTAMTLRADPRPKFVSHQLPRLKIPPDADELVRGYREVADARAGGMEYYIQQWPRRSR
jgi:hypothetical protein